MHTTKAIVNEGIMSEPLDSLQALADTEYAAFQAKLAPTIDPATCIGVRVPALRKFAAAFAKTPDYTSFMEALPHTYYDENLLHSILLTKIRDYDECLAAVERFLPYVDNWAACDTLRPAAFKKHRGELLPHVRRWIASPAPYTCRFGIDCLMEYYLDDAFDPSYLELPAAVESEEYYVRMMVAWYYATALAKQWDATIPYLEGARLEKWTHNKTIQKARESYRITPEQKNYLATLRR